MNMFEMFEYTRVEGNSQTIRSPCHFDNIYDNFDGFEKFHVCIS